MRSQFLPLLAVGALLFSACSGSDGESASSDDSDGAETDVEYESPLGDFLGWTNVDFDAEDEQARYNEQERQVQEAIATCMREEGFEYTPVDVSARNAFFDTQFEEDLEWGSKEWTEKYGFGVSTQRFAQTQVGPDLVGNNWNSFGPDEGPPDPNQDYVESLSPTEQEAYYEALYGSDQGIEWDDTLTDEENQAILDDYYENEYVPSGCEPVAFEEIFNDGQQGQWESFDEQFGEALQEMESRFESHPEVIAYRDEVRVCVEERGVEYLTDQETWEFFEGEMEAAGLGWNNEPDPFEGMDTTDFTEEDYQRVYEESLTKLLPADMLAALAEIQSVEIETAVALFDCGGGWQQEQEALGDVRIELEEEFLAANADRLAEFEGVFGN